MALKDIMSGRDGKNRAYYDALMKKCDENLARMDGELPPANEGWNETLESRGVSRRDFLKWSSIMTTVLMLPPIFDSRVAKAAEMANRIPVVWLNFSECTGCTEAVLRSSYPNIDELILETLSIEYHETLMAAAGHQAEACLEEALEKFPGQFVCVIEG
ncbi:MAG: hydrogenase, partial [bacterium]